MEARATGVQVPKLYAPAVRLEGTSDTHAQRAHALQLHFSSDLGWAHFSTPPHPLYSGRQHFISESEISHVTKTGGKFLIYGVKMTKNFFHHF